MPGAVIGKQMNLGYIGKIARDGDALIINRIVNGESDPITFGDAVFLNDDNTVHSATTSDTVDKYVGVAVATVVQATEYYTQASAYQKNKGCDIMVRGTIIVGIKDGETPVAGGQVYYDKTAHIFTATSSGSTIVIPASFTTGYIDGKGSVEITLLERNLI